MGDGGFNTSQGMLGLLMSQMYDLLLKLTDEEWKERREYEAAILWGPSGCHESEVTYLFTPWSKFLNNFKVFTFSISILFSGSSPSKYSSYMSISLF